MLDVHIYLSAQGAGHPLVPIVKKEIFWKVKKKKLKTKIYVYIIFQKKRKVHKIVILHFKNIFK